MAPREDLVSSAVTFLQDPSVAASPLQKRIEFLQSKNLAQEEIELALARASDEAYSTAQSGPQQGQGYQPPQQQAIYRSSPQYAPYGNQYGPYGDWKPPPLDIPRRDWRDWFIMATVTSGAAYGLYVLTKRYISPIISPPTPPQLEADKAAIDEQFTRAFSLLDTLSSDTATLKSAEEARTERLDKALDEVETVVSELKTATRRREDETRRLNDEIRGLKEGIPRALDGHREGSERRLRELGAELKSLKLLMGNRFGQQAPGTVTSGMGTANSSSQQQSSQQAKVSSGTNTPTTETPAPTENGANATPSASAASSMSSYTSSTAPSYQFPTTSSGLPPVSRAASSSPFPGSSGGSGGAGKAAIPAWQMAAASKKASVQSSGAGGGGDVGST